MYCKGSVTPPLLFCHGEQAVAAAGMASDLLRAEMVCWCWNLVKASRKVEKFLGDVYETGREDYHN